MASFIKTCVLFACIIFIACCGTAYGNKNDDDMIIGGSNSGGGEVMLGAPKSANMGDQYLGKALEAGLSLHNQKSGSNLTLVATQIVDAKQQVVSGTLYDITFKAGYTADGASLNSFYVKSGSPSLDSVKTYRMKVQFQAWMQPQYTLVSIQEV
eukprot:CAMPEP_0113936586 /NCGR_PEP_ID=MMETSP1339-20121228/3469_1 /TAXON_ID=94617 /ORGANISM="Fibrocapsa japonica" /LENGTH=153 /DNA_ID=CAMNT_0000939113 /DNA_START=77 /DNA_END=538 /DNA_ORIENTATION=- /assembly_acc=CAM_ASM_000762